MYLRSFLLIAVVLLASCGGGDNDYTFTSLEHSFERASSEQRGKSAEIVEQLFVTSPKFGQERMADAHQHALAIIHRCDSVIAAIDSFKQILAKGNAGEAETGAFARTLKEMLHPALVLHIVAHATYDSIDSVRLYDTIADRKYDAFENIVEWPELHFTGSAAKTQMELSRIKHDIAAAEWLALYKLIEDANPGCVLKFSPYGGVAIPMNSYVLPGDRFEANVLFLYRPDTPAYKVKEITMNGQKLDVVNGVGRYKEIARTPGLHDVRGKVIVDGPDGYPITSEVKVEYMVARPVITIETESLRTIFAGRHNALSVKVTGFEAKDVVVNADRGTLSTGNDKYDLYVEDTGVVRLVVSAKLRSGKILPVDTQFLRAIIHK